MKMKIIPLTLSQANDLVTTLHRHHKPTVGHRFSLGLIIDDELHGAVIVGRPVSRRFPPYTTAEVTRLVTDGTVNACSFLYGAAARICKEMGFTKIQTYTLESEPGTSLKAAGWKNIRISPGGDWNVPTRRGRRTDQPQESKKYWVKDLNPQ